jgi:hypothetical protein
MIGNATLKDLPKEKVKASQSLYQINMDSFPSSIKSIEGYHVHAVMSIDDNS